jgi:hypothetical protein
MRVVKILIALALIAGSCGQTTNKEKQVSTANNEEIVSEDTEEQRFPENLDIKTDVEILLPAGYRGTEPAEFQAMLSEEWYDFYQDYTTKKYFLKKAVIEIGKFYDDCIGDSTTYVNSSRQPLVLIKGIAPQDNEVFSIPVKKQHVWVGEKYSFSFNKKTYLFRGDGNTIESGKAWIGDVIERWDVVENYKLYLSEQGKAEQLIADIPKFVHTFVQILWIGDLDNDGNPDFLLDISSHYEEKTVLLFLSSKAENGEIVKMAGISSYVFDC